MDSYLLAIPLPQEIKSRLSSLCYGIPHMNWLEEDALHITLRHLGPLPDQDASHILDLLKNLFFLKFQLTLKGVDYSSANRKKGMIWAGVEDNDALLSLRKEVDDSLRSYVLQPKERLFQPHVVLGRCEKIHPLKLAEYLSIHSHLKLGPFLVSRCQLLITRQTPKRLFFQLAAEFGASSPATGED